MKSANRRHVDNHVEAIRDANLYSSGLYDALAKMPGFNFELEKNGIMLLYKTPEVEREEIEVAQRGRDLGLDIDVLDSVGIQELEPHLKIDVRGGIRYKCDGKLCPQKLMRQLIAYLKEAGVDFQEYTHVTKFVQAGQRVKQVQTNRGDFTADEVVLATGASLPELASKLGLKIPVMPGKGYSFMYTPEGERQLQHAALLVEARVAVTPMDGQIRFSGTMELGSANNTIYQSRVKGIVEAIPRYFPSLDVDYPRDKVWFGYRPCSPDGIPYLGRLNRFANVTVAGGAGMMGLSLGPAFGKTIADILGNRFTEIDIQKFKPDRFS